MGALHPDGKMMYSCEGMRDELSDRFLNGDLKDRTLANVADIVVSEYDRDTLQSFIHEILEPFQPADFHKIIPLIPWQSIVTTNYDLIIERAYASVPDRVCEIIPYLRHGDKIDYKLSLNPRAICYMKLHGCVSNHGDRTHPIVLSKEQLSRYRKSRDRLIDRFQSYAEQFHVIFAGYSINDSHVREVLFDLTGSEIDRPRYYFVSPNQSRYDVSYWAANRITVLNADFETFLLTLNDQLIGNRRKLATIVLRGETTLRSHYKTANPVESDLLHAFLDKDVWHIHFGMSANGKPPAEFYSGYDDSWWPIEQCFDISRRITDSIIVEAILDDSKQLFRFFLIRGPAGNGKTVALKRVAWDAAIDYEKVVLYLREGGALKFDAIREAFDLTGKRLYIFIDHAALYVDEIEALAAFAKRNKIPITAIVTERDNEWNTRCENLDSLVSNDFPVPYLNKQEIHLLLKKLEEHDCLNHLADLSPEDRFSAFHDRAQRQLLVALHETTLGKPFEEIVLDEYERIYPAQARVLYLDICTLNRLDVPVRAGLISRVSGVSFARFKEAFFSPLEHIVRYYDHPYLPDAMFEARHAHVAGIVFDHVLKNAEERYDQLVRLLAHLNIEYKSDLEAFRSLMRGHSIVDAFPSAELGRRLFEIAIENVGRDAFLLQQYGIFEMNHKGGDLARAERWLRDALEIAPWDQSIRHTYANLCRRRSLVAKTDLEKEQLRKEARRYLPEVKDRKEDRPHGRYTKTQLALDELKELLQRVSPQNLGEYQRVIEEKIKEIEQNLAYGLQHFPKRENFLVLESEFLQAIFENDAAVSALKKAFERNPRNELVASRLASTLMRDGKMDEGLAIMKRCLEQNPASKLIHYRIARHYIDQPSKASSRFVIDHLMRSFSPGDQNFEARFWLARELFVQGQIADASRYFEETKEAKISPKVRHQLRGFVTVEGNDRIFRGEIVRMEASYCWISCPEFGTKIFAHVSQSDASVWEELRLGMEVSYKIGFNMRGPQATILQVVRESCG